MEWAGHMAVLEEAEWGEAEASVGVVWAVRVAALAEAEQAGADSVEVAWADPDPEWAIVGWGDLAEDLEVPAVDSGVSEAWVADSAGRAAAVSAKEDPAASVARVVDLADRDVATSDKGGLAEPAVSVAADSAARERVDSEA